ncbi:MAG: Coenzyme F420 hydrogenase/dehydrogenase, beta subunit C-terminal domain [Deltaproteobacteria bacterium]|nr:Coenzyme F420 hydrogenase/dehydrogenase, beta subunit C-terminal domain [Deltaproteobacteria bacterium]
MKLYGPTELMEDVLGKDLCIGCGACIDLCPYFRSHRGKTRNLFPCTLAQGRCWAYCPKVEVDLDELSRNLFDKPYQGDPLGYNLEVKISKAGEKISSSNFQAGGTVTALMSFALSKGYIDAVVLTDREGLKPVPRIVTKPEDIISCSSSKYSAAPTLSALNQALKNGHNHLGVVGTPCQVLALTQMRSNPLGEENFTDPTGLVVGLFCTWSIDFQRFETFLSKQMDIEKITKIDIPPPPAEIMEIYIQDNKIGIPLDEIRKLVPDTCSYCIDMSAEFSDVSVGVLEGRPDMNTLIIRTQRGKQIVEEAEKEGFLLIDDIPQENLEHLKWAAGNKKKKALLKVKQQKRLNTTEEGRRAYLRIYPETIEQILS